MCGVCSAFHVPRSVVSIAGQDLNLRPPGYEPGELPDCSTPRRNRNYTIEAMNILLWSALGVSAVFVTAGLAVASVTALAFWRDLRSLSREVFGALGKLAASTEATADRLESIGESTTELQAALERLNASVARARILRGAVQDVRDPVD